MRTKEQRAEMINARYQAHKIADALLIAYWCDGENEITTEYHLNDAREGIAALKAAIDGIDAPATPADPNAEGAAQ